MDALSFTLWLEFEHWEAKPDDDPEDEFCNVRIDLSNGEAYALDIWTFKFLERAHREDQGTGENLSGRYLVSPDLLVTRLDRATMEEVFTELAQAKQLKQEWRVPPESFVMTEQQQDTTKLEGYGRGSFVLGYGSSGVFGHIALLLQAVPHPGQYSVQWQVKGSNHAEEAQEQVEKATSEYLRKYVAGHPEDGFLAIITEVTSDAERRNDYDRAVNLALRSALEEMGLPVPQIFGL